MYKDLKALFGTEVSSVRKFKQKLKNLPPEEQHDRRIYAKHAAFCDRSNLPVSYRNLLSNLIQNDWQGALDFLVNDTVLSTLRYPLQDPDLLFKMLALLEGRKQQYAHFAFILLLVFESPYKVSYLGDLLRTRRLDTDELGNFRYTFGSAGVTEDEKFETKMIREPKVRFFPGRAGGDRVGV